MKELLVKLALDGYTIRIMRTDFFEREHIEVRLSKPFNRFNDVRNVVRVVSDVTYLEREIEYARDELDAFIKENG